MLRTWRMALLGAAVLAVAAGSAHAQTCRDVNNDGTVSATDGSVLDNRLLNPSLVICGGPTTANIDCADLNDNGVLDPGDSVLLAQTLAGVETLFPPCTRAPAATCPGGPVSGNITTSTHWGPAPCTVDLAGAVLVIPPAVLTVDPGVVVRGVVNVSNPAALIVIRGAKLDANGTAADPIVFTSNAAPGARGPGNWGGVTLNGSAPVNFDGGEGSSEGLPPGLALYGGSDVADNSGRVRFTRVEFSGIEFSEDNELNVFTMNAVGTGTVIDHVQAHRGNDDCHEWFGGTVRTKYLVSTACRDDDFDWQIGFRGSLQFGLSHKAAAAVPDGSGRNGFESDNNEFGFDNLPRANPRMCNVTTIGARPQGLAISGSGANLRRGTAGTISNTIFTGWVSACLDIDNDETIARGCLNSTTLRTGADTLLVKDSICFNNGPSGTTVSTGTVTGGAACTPAQLVGLWAPSTADPGIAAAASFPTNPINTALYVPSGALSGPDCEAVDPAAFDSAPFIGALQNGGINWLDDSSACAPGQVADCWLNVDLN